MERPPNVSDVCATPSLEVARCPAVLLHLRKMADRIQARAIRRCGELLKQVGNDDGGRPKENHDGADIVFTRSSAAREAGMSERQKVTALRVANVPEPVFHQAVESETPPTVTQLAEIGKQSKPTPLPTSSLPTSIAATLIKVNRPWPPQWHFLRRQNTSVAGQFFPQERME